MKCEFLNTKANTVCMILHLCDSQAGFDLMSPLSGLTNHSLPSYSVSSPANPNEYKAWHRSQTQKLPTDSLQKYFLESPIYTKLP